MSWRLGDEPVSRVLVTRLRYLGDVVMSTVVLDALRAGDPGLDLGYLCEAAHAPALAGHPLLSRVHALGVTRRGPDARARAAGPASGAAAVRTRGAAGTVLDLRAARYDLAVDLFFNPRSAWLLRLAGVPRRLSGPAGSRGWLYTHQVDAREARERPEWARLAPGGLGDHLARLAPLTHVESGLGFIDWFTGRDRPASPRLAPRTQAPARAAALLRAAGLPADAPYLLLAPGATWATKKWPAEHWRSLAAGLDAFWNGSVIVLTPPGGEADARFGSIIAAGRGGTLPPLPLVDVLDVLAASSGLISVDGGVMHAAVGLQVPTLALFGPTDPRLWFPYGADGRFRVLATKPLCHPCDLHDCGAFICLPELSPSAVLALARDLFSGKPATDVSDGARPSGLPEALP
jgi:ADP-heptose:LPS heptosyltransferase